LKHLREREEEEFVEFHKMAERIDKRDRVILRNAEERKTFEEVFDRSTLMILNSLANKKAFSYLNGVVSSGKESRVYWGVKEDGRDVAVKIYLTSSSDFKRRMQYVIGDPRFAKFRRDSRGVAELWARKEFTNLKEAYEAGVRVPRPEQFLGNVLVMEFIGKNGTHASRLTETEITKRDYLAVIKAIRILYSKAKLVHADLSEYNIFKYENKVILFDFGSAVSIRHPLTEEFLKRDILNVNRFFEKRGIEIVHETELLSEIKGEPSK
jgi:RIO kinase 1